MNLSFFLRHREILRGVVVAFVYDNYLMAIFSKVFRANSSSTPASYNHDIRIEHVRTCLRSELYEFVIVSISWLSVNRNCGKSKNRAHGWACFQPYLLEKRGEGFVRLLQWRKIRYGPVPENCLTDSYGLLVERRCVTR